MSNYLAFATVTEALRQLIEQGALDAELPGAEAIVQKPSANMSAGHPTGFPNAYAGLYPYLVTPNAQGRNINLPARRSDGSLIQGIRSAYDLNFLVACYGDDSKLEPERVLGGILRRLATEPVLTKAMIKNATLGPLVNNNLDSEIETIKFSLLPLSLEELSKVWSVFFQTAYHLSFALQASIIFIDGTQNPGPALPVLRRNLYVRTINQPAIEQVLSQKTSAGPILAREPIVSGDILVLQGRQLRGEVTLLRFGDLEVVPDDVSETQIKIALNSPPFLIDSLRSGVQGVQVIQRINMGTPELPHQGFESNVAAFVMHPTLTPGAVVVTHTDIIDTVTYKDATIALTINPKVGLKQRVALLLNELNPPADRAPHAYRFELKLPTTPPDPTGTITAQVSSVAAGNYLLRVQVDGAESLLDPGADPLNPKYVGPVVTI